MSDYASIVREHHRRTTAYLFAQSEPCRTMREEEIRRIQRRLEPLDLGSLPGFRPTASWMLAVLLCLGDDLSPLVGAIRSLEVADLDRVRFYAHPDVDVVETLRPWYAANLPDPLLTFVSDWRTLHPYLGRDLNDRVYRDFAPSASPS